MKPSITSSMATRATGQDLMHGGADLVSLSIRAARASSAVRRAALGGSLDAEDQTVLSVQIQLLQGAAASVQFFDSSGRAGSRPSGALATQVDAAIDAVLDTADTQDQVELSTRLSDLADQVQRVVDGDRDGALDDLANFFAELGKSVLRQSGSVGELTSTL